MTHIDFILTVTAENVLDFVDEIIKTEEQMEYFENLKNKWPLPKGHSQEDINRQVYFSINTMYRAEVV